MISELDTFLKQNGVGTCEGHSGQSKAMTQALTNIVQKHQVGSVFEIGFNGGHSSNTFLATNPELKVVSVDIGHWKCVKIGKEFIDSKYPERHRLIIGNSLTEVPKFAASTSPAERFDMILIDGGHDYPIAKGDLENCRALANSETLVVMDDIVHDVKNKMFYNDGPNRAWSEAVASGEIVEMGHFESGEKGRGISWGKYKV